MNFSVMEIPKLREEKWQNRAKTENWFWGIQEAMFLICSWKIRTSLGTSLSSFMTPLQSQNQQIPLK